MQKAHRTLHRALADSDLTVNRAKLPKRYRPRVRNRKPAVYPTVAQVDGRSLYVKGPKSKNGCRTIGLDPDTIRQLRRHRDRMREDRLAAGASYQLEPLDHLVGEVHDH